MYQKKNVQKIFCVFLWPLFVPVMCQFNKLNLLSDFSFKNFIRFFTRRFLPLKHIHCHTVFVIHRNVYQFVDRFLVSDLNKLFFTIHTVASMHWDNFTMYTVHMVQFINEFIWSLLDKVTLLERSIIEHSLVRSPILTN